MRDLNSQSHILQTGTLSQQTPSMPLRRLVAVFERPQVLLGTLVALVCYHQLGLGPDIKRWNARGLALLDERPQLWSAADAELFFQHLNHSGRGGYMKWHESWDAAFGAFYVPFLVALVANCRRFVCRRKPCCQNNSGDNFWMQPHASPRVEVSCLLLVVLAPLSVYLFDILENSCINELCARFDDECLKGSRGCSVNSCSEEGNRGGACNDTVSSSRLRLACPGPLFSGLKFYFGLFMIVLLSAVQCLLRPIQGRETLVDGPQ